MLTPGALARRYGYSGLLTTLFALMFVGPLFAGREGEALMLGVLVICTAGSAIYAAGGSPAKQVTLGILALFYVVGHFMQARTGGAVWVFSYNAGGASFFALVTWVLLHRILSATTHVTGELIAGSIAVYLLLGIAFAYLFALVELHSPGAFAFADRAGHADPDFYYYSLVTLTTLGYGDITPLAPMARGLAALEAVIGPVYLTVLVARLVGMHISGGSDTPGGQQ